MHEKQEKKEHPKAEHPKAEKHGEGEKPHHPGKRPKEPVVVIAREQGTYKGVVYGFKDSFTIDDVSELEPWMEKA